MRRCCGCGAPAPAARPCWSHAAAHQAHAGSPAVPCSPSPPPPPVPAAPCVPPPPVTAAAPPPASRHRPEARPGAWPHPRHACWQERARCSRRRAPLPLRHYEPPKQLPSQHQRQGLLSDPRLARAAAGQRGLGRCSLLQLRAPGGSGPARGPAAAHPCRAGWRLWTARAAPAHLAASCPGCWWLAHHPTPSRASAARADVARAALAHAAPGPALLQAARRMAVLPPIQTCSERLCAPRPAGCRSVWVCLPHAGAGGGGGGGAQQALLRSATRGECSNPNDVTCASPPGAERSPKPLTCSLPCCARVYCSAPRTRSCAVHARCSSPESAARGWPCCRGVPGCRGRRFGGLLWEEELRGADSGAAGWAQAAVHRRGAEMRRLWQLPSSACAVWQLQTEDCSAARGGN